MRNRSRFHLELAQSDENLQVVQCLGQPAAEDRSGYLEKSTTPPLIILSTVEAMASYSASV